MTTPPFTDPSSGSPSRSRDKIDDIIARLRRRLPEEPLEPLRLIGIGFSTVAIGNDEMVCRVPLNREAAAAQGRLRDLLPLLAPHLPAPIPLPRRMLPAGEDFPFGVLITQKLSGQPLADSCTAPTIANTLADFLATLHRLPVTLAPASLLLPHDREEVNREVQAGALPAFQAVVSAEERVAAEQWWDAFFADPDRRDCQSVTVHGDFWHENLLVNTAGDRVTGILDWENCGIGDPAMDLAPLRHANSRLADAVTTRYARRTGTTTKPLRRRAQWQFGLREWAGLARTVQLGDSVELPDAIAKVRAVVADVTWKEG